MLFSRIVAYIGRGPATAAVLGLAVVSSLAVAVEHGGPSILTAVAILCISIVCFTAIAVMNFENALVWKLVDFPWVLASFAAIVSNTNGIIEADRRSEQADLRYRVSVAQDEVRSSFYSVIYATQMVLTLDCNPVPGISRRKPDPEPYPNACVRMTEFLPQMINEYEIDRQRMHVEDFEGWVRNILVPNITPLGEWSGQYDTARSAMAAIEKHRAFLTREAKQGSISQQTVVGKPESSKATYWYYLMAFFVGVRLSKTTAEVLQTIRASKKKA